MKSDLSNVNSQSLQNFCIAKKWKQINNHSNNFATYYCTIADEYFKVVIPLQKNTAHYDDMIANCLDTINRAYGICEQDLVA